MIRFEHVTRRYERDGRPALDDVSVEFDRGDFVFLIGASGSGKSTLLRMILREGLPQHGRLTVAGQNLGLMLERRVPAYRRSIGMVFQDFRLLPDKTVYDNVAFAMNVIGARRAQTRARVTDVLETVGLDHLGRRYPHEISGGEQQRAAIARAIVNEPAVLLADEPTGNLDPRASTEVMKILRWINASGTTVIMATHDRPIVDQMRRRVVQLHHGVLVRDDPQGTYDPPRGSRAWELLNEQEVAAGLRAIDPKPAGSGDYTDLPDRDRPEKAEDAGESEDSAADLGAEAAQAYRITWPEDRRPVTAQEPAEQVPAGVDGTELTGVQQEGFTERDDSAGQADDEEFEELDALDRDEDEVRFEEGRP